MKVVFKVVFFALISIVLFLFIFSFIVQNPHDTRIDYYFGVVWEGSTAILLVFTLGVGILIGIFASGLGLLTLKIRLMKAGKQLKALQSNHSLGREQITKDGI